MRLLFFLSIFSVLLFSCKKGKADFTIKGVITDQSFGIPFSNANIYIYEKEAGTGQPALISEMVTDGNGAYSFTFSRNQVESYLLTTSKLNYFDLNETIPFTGLTIENDNVFNFSVTAKAWAKLRIVHTNAQPGDAMRIIKSAGKSDCTYCFPSGELYFYDNVDTSLIYINDGNTTLSYNYLLIGTAFQGAKSANTTPFDTTEILLNY